MLDSPEPSFFEDAEAAREFHQSFVEHLSLLQKTAVAQVLGNRTAQRFTHGTRWEAPPDSPSLPAKMRQHSAEIETKFEDIANHNLAIVPAAFEKLRTAMHAQFMQMLYSTISDACETTGNTIDAKKSGSIEEAFIAMFERIQFSADKSGNVSMPEIHAGAEAMEKFRQMQINATPEFKKRVEELITRKKEEAIDREKARKARFARYED